MYEPYCVEGGAKKKPNNNNNNKQTNNNKKTTRDLRISAAESRNIKKQDAKKQKAFGLVFSAGSLRASTEKI